MEIPVLRYDRTVGTRKESGSREWKARCKRGTSHFGKSGWQWEAVMRSEIKSVSYTHLHEDGKDVYNVSMEQLGYSLDQDILKSALETLKQERSGTFKLFASQRDYKIDYQIIRDEAQEQAALSADHFDEKDRTEPTDAHIRYSKKKQKYVLVNQVSGNQIDENRLLSYVEETLDKD